MADRDDVRRALAGDRDLSGADLSRADLSGADLSGADLRDANLRDANLRDANLRDAKFRGADLTGADLSRADLSGADLAHAKFVDAKLIRSTLAGAYFNRTYFTGADLSEVNLREAALRGGSFRGTRFINANLREADLRKVNLREAKFSGADLSGADLSRADLSRADLSGADLRHASLLETYLLGADLTGSNLRGADTAGAYFANAKGVKMPKPSVVAIGSAYGRASGAVLKLIADGPTSAREFKRKYPAEFERVKSLSGGRDFDEKTIRVISEKSSGARWIVTRKKYSRSEQRLCGRPNDVLLFNIDLERAPITDAQREILGRIAEVSRHSRHPHERDPLFTIGWVRYCDDGRIWLIEEVQSDVLAVRYKLNDKMTRSQLSDGGIDPERYKDAIAAIRLYTERFYEDALGVTFALAKQRGRTVEMLTYESKQEMGSPQNVYSELPRSMGMVRRDRGELLPSAPAWHYRPNPARRRGRR